MESSSQPLPCRSLQDQKYYLLVRACGKCGSGPWEEIFRQRRQSPAGAVDALRVRCQGCGQEEQLEFLKPGQLNRTACSSLIDVGQWLGLCHRFLDLAQTGEDAEEVHKHIVSARFCLNEALKFYHSDSNLPPPEAFFGQLGEQRFKEHPTVFLKTKLVDLRGRLSRLEPKSSKKRPSRVGPKRKWWRTD